MSWSQRIDQALNERREADAFRRRQPVAQGPGVGLSVKIGAG